MRYSLVIGISLLLSACEDYPVYHEPTCEERGGKNVYTHTLFIPMLMGKFTMLQQYPQYECQDKDGKAI